MRVSESFSRFAIIVDAARQQDKAAAGKELAVVPVSVDAKVHIHVCRAEMA